MAGGGGGGAVAAPVIFVWVDEKQRAPSGGPRPWRVCQCDDPRSPPSPSSPPRLHARCPPPPAPAARRRPSLPRRLSCSRPPADGDAPARPQRRATGEREREGGRERGKTRRVPCVDFGLHALSLSLSHSRARACARRSWPALAHLCWRQGRAGARRAAAGPRVPGVEKGGVALSPPLCALLSRHARRPNLSHPLFFSGPPPYHPADPPLPAHHGPSRLCRRRRRGRRRHRHRRRRRPPGRRRRCPGRPGRPPPRRPARRHGGRGWGRGRGRLHHSDGGPTHGE